jgi:biopolymer transport protein ExbD
MRVRNVQRYGEGKIDLQMTPMIDVVFQLIAFFVLTFKLVAPEGDFNIKMPLAAPSVGKPDDSQLPPTKITLRADQNGMLSGIVLGKRPIPDFARLRREIRNIVDDAGGPGSAGAAATEVELDCAYQLRFEYVMDAITAISGYVTNDGRIIRLLEKVKFSPPKARP